MRFKDLTEPAKLRSNQFRGIGIGVMFVLHSYTETYTGTDNQSVVYIKISSTDALPLTGGTKTPSKFSNNDIIHIVKISEISYKRGDWETV